MQNKYLISVVEASKRFGIGRDKLYSLIRSEPDLPTIKIGETVKINAPLFEEFLNRCTEEGRTL